MEKVDGDHGSWRAGGGARAARACFGLLATSGPSWCAWTLMVATWGLAGFRPLRPCQGLQVPKTKGPVDLGPLTWTPWEAVVIKVGKSCPRPWPSRSSGPVLAEDAHVFPAGLIRSLPFTDTLEAREPSSPAVAQVLRDLAECPGPQGSSALATLDFSHCDLEVIPLLQV